MEDKKGFLGNLLGNKKAKKKPCSCGCVVLEEIPAEANEKKNEKESPEDKKTPCCNG